MRSGLSRICWYGLGVLMVVQAVGVHLLAGITNQVPEIDGGSISAGLGLLTAGILILRSRRRSK